MSGRDKCGQLLADPPVVKFTQRQLDSFLTYAKRVDDATVVSAIQSAEDLLIDDTGKRKVDGYRYTHLAMGQLCTATATGLMRLISDVAGVVRRPNSYDDVISVPTASRIFNACVKLRFLRKDGVYGKQLIGNTRDKTIDGLVGALYKQLPNYYLCEMANEAFRSQTMLIKFHNAQLVGRRLCMAFLSEASFNVGGKAYSYGVYLVNSEAGECSVQAAMLIGQRDSSLRCIGKLRRLPHTGKKFSRNLAKLLGQVLRDLEERVRYYEHFVSLSQKEVDLTQEANKVMMRHRLERWGVEAPIAKITVDWVAHAGSAAKVPPTSRHKAEAANRTELDLFNRLVADAEEYAPKIREIMEHAAFLLLASAH